MKSILLALPLLLSIAAPAAADKAAFHPGKVLPDYGKVATVANDLPLPADAVWKHSFDVSEGESGTLNQGMESAARFLNMMDEAGVRPEQLKIAIVLHGPSVLDATMTARYQRKYPKTNNPNEKMIAALIAAGVDIWVCGQSAEAQDVAKSDLQVGVKMALSAMTAHAELQRQGYSVNPF